MVLTMGKREMELPGKYLGELRDANDILDDTEALRRRMEIRLFLHPASQRFGIVKDIVRISQLPQILAWKLHFPLAHCQDHLLPPYLSLRGSLLQAWELGDPKLRAAIRNQLNRLQRLIRARR